MNQRMREIAISLIEQEAMPVPECGCWIWLADETLTFDGHVTTPERLVYEAFNKPLLNGEKIIHKCNLDCCVNPEHLSVVRDAPRQRNQSEIKYRTLGELHHSSG